MAFDLSEESFVVGCALLFFSFFWSRSWFSAVLSLSLVLFAFLRVRFIDQLSPIPVLLSVRVFSLAASAPPPSFDSRVLTLFFLNSVRRRSSSFTLFNDQLYFHDFASFYLCVTSLILSPSNLLASNRVRSMRRVSRFSLVPHFQPTSFLHGSSRLLLLASFLLDVGKGRRTLLIESASDPEPRKRNEERDSPALPSSSFPSSELFREAQR